MLEKAMIEKLNSGIDKLDASFNMRIPIVTKNALDKLSDTQKKLLHDEILVTMAHRLYENDFDPMIYLKS